MADDSGSSGAGGIVSDLGGAVGGLLGGLFGSSAAAGATGEAHNDAVIANNILQSIQQAPDISKPLLLQQYIQQGLMTPAMEQAVQLGQSQVSQIGTDQGSLNAQRAALQQLQQTGQMGMTASERNALNQIQQESAARVQGNQQAILNQLHAQAGGAGSMAGLQLMQQLQAEQGGANAAAQQSSNVMGNAQQSALQAISQAGALGGQINQQQFGQAATKAQAADEFNRFNVQAQQQAQNANVQAQNQAQLQNLTQAQNLANANVTSANQEQYNQLQRQMQQYGANVNTAQIQAGGYNNLAGFNQKQGQQAAQAGANTGAGVGGVLGDVAALALNKGGKVPDMHSPVSMYNSGGYIDFRDGGKVPGKEVVPGDSPKNDTVPIMASAGELVVPKSIAQTSFGKRLSKLLEDHHQLRKDMGD